MPAAKTTLRNSLPRDVFAVAAISPRWAFADVGIAAATVLIPLGGGVYGAWKAERTIRSMLVARKVWALAVAGRSIAKGVAAQVDLAGTPIPAGKTAEIHKMGLVHRWTRPSGIAVRFGAAPLKIVVSDEGAERIAAFACSPGTRWTVGESGVTAADGTASPWVKES